jgi:hypothetical protein
MPEQSLSREFWPSVCPGYSFLTELCLWNSFLLPPVGFSAELILDPSYYKHVTSNSAHNLPNSNLILLDSNV